MTPLSSSATTLCDLQPKDRLAQSLEALLPRPTNRGPGSEHPVPACAMVAFVVSLIDYVAIGSATEQLPRARSGPAATPHDWIVAIAEAGISWRQRAKMA